MAARRSSGFRGNPIISPPNRLSLNSFDVRWFLWELGSRHKL